MKKIIFTMMVGIAMVFTANGQALKVASNGDVGVGTGTPGAKLHVAEGTANLYIHQSTATGAGIVDITPGLTGSTRVGSLSTTSNAFGGAAFQAWSDAAPAFKGQFYFDAGAAATGDIYFRTRAPGATTRLVVKKDGKIGMGILAPTETLDVSGNIKATGTITGSDRRLKSDISDFTDGLDQVMKLRPVHFTYNGKGGTVQGDKHVGLIAQELQEIAPEMVKEFTFTNMKEATLDEEYQVISKENYLAIKDNEIKYMLVNAIQDQQKLIEEKEERIVDLEDKLLALEEKVNNIVNQYDVNLGGGLSDAGLSQNIPNPFNGETQIAYSVPEKATSASMNIYDFNGRLLKTINISHTGKGMVNIKANDLPAGTYSYQFVVDNQIIGAKKMIKGN